MKHIRLVLFGLTLLAMSVSTVSAQTNTPKAKTSGWVIEAAPAGGGFAGIRTEEVLTKPRLTCQSSNGEKVCATDPNNQVLVKNSRYTIRPTLSTGIVFRWLPNKHADNNGAVDENAFGFGIGTHMVFLSSGSDGGTSRFAPAVTAHVGTRKAQFFVGSVFASIDSVSFPDNATELVLPNSFDGNRFVLPNHGRALNLFMGIVIGGLSITK